MSAPAPSEPSDPYAGQLAEAFRGRYAAVADIIRASDSPEDCIAKVRQWALSADIKNPALILEQALNAYAYHGARSSAKNDLKSDVPE